LTTMRRKEAREGVFDMVPAGVLMAPAV
jgi:hypothetical protein